MSKKNLARLATQTARLSIAAPQVIGGRITKIAAAGAAPDSRDIREINRMHSEKATAWAQSWTAMGVEIARTNQRFALDLAGACFRTWTNLAFTAVRLYPWHSAALAVMTKGLAPFERRVAENYRRLTRL